MPEPKLLAITRRPTLVAARIQVSLTDQTWAKRTIDGAPCFRAFLLLHGRAVFAAPVRADRTDRPAGSLGAA